MFFRDEKVIDIIKSILLKLPNSIPGSLVETLHLDSSGPTCREIKDMEWFVFSDNILVTMEIPFIRTPNLVEKSFIGLRWLIFFHSCAILMRQMFEKGLPLRGAVDYGQYYIEEKCFAGKPIINAYNDASTQNWCGCTISEEVWQTYKNFLDSSVADSKYAKGIILEYEVPRKNDKYEKRSVINWVFLPGNTVLKRIAYNEKKFVEKAFCSHNKHVENNAFTKINNTEKFLGYVKAKVPIKWD